MKDTVQTTSLQRTLPTAPKVDFPIVLIHFHFRRMDNLSTVDELAGPNVSFEEVLLYVYLFSILLTSNVCPTLCIVYDDCCYKQCVNKITQRTFI